MSKIAKAFAEENNPLGVHYDVSKEIRAKGAGFYQFSADEETRKAESARIKSPTRGNCQDKELGAIRPGDTEGMRDGEGQHNIQRAG